jgi:hypothetical protein
MKTIVDIVDPFLGYVVYVCATISLLSTIFWSVFNIKRKKLLSISICLTIAFVILLFPYYYLWLILVFSPMVAVHLQFPGPLMLLITSIFVFRNFKGKQIIAGISYVVNLIILIIGLGFLTSLGGTSGNSMLWFGIHLVFNTILILQILTYVCESNFFYGLLKLSFGILTSAIIIVSGLDGGSTTIWNPETVLLSRISVIFVTAILIVEGVFLIYKSHKSKQRKPDQYD